MKPKFGIKDKVIHLADGEVCEVLKIHMEEDSITYTITSKEVDVKAKEIIYGVKTVEESELKAYE